MSGKVKHEEAGGSAMHQSTSILESGISCIYLCLYMHVCSLLMGQIGR